MSLSPDECKWSERLTPTQRGMRCGFTGTCACEWDVLEEVAMSTVWNTVEKEGGQKRVISACVYHSRLLPTPLPLKLSPPQPPYAYRASHRKTHWPQRVEECVCGCAFVCPASPINLNTFLYFPLDSVLHLKFQPTIKRAWITSCPVPVTSSLTSIWPHAVFFNCHYNCVSWRACSPYSHMLSPACIMNTHTCRPTLTPLQMKYLSRQCWVS